MQKCPKCLAEQNNVNSSACYYCGADMSNALVSDNDSYSDSYLKDKDDYIPEKSISLPDTDDLGIETNADMMESEAHQLIDTSPLNSAYDDNINNNIHNYNSTLEKDDSKKNSSYVKKLTDEEIKEIEINLYKKNDYINDREKSDLIEKISAVKSSEPEPFSNTPIQPPHNENKIISSDNTLNQAESDFPKPQISKKGQGLAFFYKNYIKIEGSQKIYPEDEMIINGRSYALKPKNLNKNIVLYSFVALLILSVSVVGSFLAGNSGVGDGQVFGLILDKNNNPYIEGATIVFGELNKKSQSDAQGLFSFVDIPAGSHKIEYRINGKTIGSDYITVADNKSSFITLRPLEKIVTQPIEQIQQLAQVSAEVKQKEVVKTNEVSQSTIKTNSQTKTKTSSEPKPKNTSPSKSEYGKIILNANVDGAKIKVDGNVLGAGNLTYSKIKSGKHSYTVSLDGYETISGTFELNNDETKELTPNLKALTLAKKEEKFKGNDYLYSAQNAFNQEDYATAIADYNKVIEESPSSSEAYYGLAESYAKQKKWDNAYDNYVKAAEIHRFKKRINDAISCYGKAVEVDNKKTTAFIGRGDIYLSEGEFRAAFGDFDKVVKLDKRNFDGYFGMGEASFNLQRYGKAIEYFKDARSLQNENTLVHQYLTLSYMYEHDRKNSKNSFEKFNQYASENEKNKFQKNSQYPVVKKYIESE